MDSTPQNNNSRLELVSSFDNNAFKMKIDGKTYEVSTHFNPEGSQSVFQQFRDLILSEALLENA